MSSAAIKETKIVPFAQFREKYKRKCMLHSDLAGRKAQMWQFIDKATKKECTVKVVPKEKVDRSRILRELTILKECNGHPNLQTVIEAYECPKFFYIVTENLDHPTVMESLTSNKRRLDPKSAGTILRVLLNALVYLHDPKSASKMHQVQIVHGNINAKTVLVPTDSSSFNRLLLVDFSHAIMVDEAANGSDQEDGKDTHHKHKKLKQKKPNRFQPPEFLKTGPTEKGDMWALGVLVFLLLTGKYPFSKPSEAKEGIKNWHAIKSPKIKEVIEGLLAYNPEDRSSAAQVNQLSTNIFYNELTAENQDDLNTVFQRLTDISQEYELKKAVRSYIAANLLQESHMERLCTLFQLADFNNDNALSRTEFQRVILEADVGIPLESIDKFFSAVDINGDKKISFSEFMAFAEKEEVLFEKQKLRAAFDAFDWSSTGYIIADDLKNFSASAGGASAFRGDGVLEDETIEYMMEEADKNGDGKISFEEFADMMLKQPYFAVFSW